MSKQCFLHPCWHGHPAHFYLSSFQFWSTNHVLTNRLCLFLPLPLQLSFSQRPVLLLSQSLLQLGSFPAVSGWVTWSRPLSPECCDSTVSGLPLRMMSCPCEVTILSQILSTLPNGLTSCRSLESTTYQTELWIDMIKKHHGRFSWQSSSSSIITHVHSCLACPGVHSRFVLTHTHTNRID